MSSDRSPQTSGRPSAARTLSLIMIALLALLLLSLMGPWGEAKGEEAGFYQIGGFGGAYKNTHHDGTYLYTTHYQGLSIFDLSDPDRPERIGFCLTGGFAYGLYVSGSHAYVGDGYDNLLVIDVSDPTDPRIVGEAPNEWFAAGIHVQDQYAYVADGYYQVMNEGGLLIYDVSDPAAPRLEGKLSTPQGGPNAVVVVDTYAYVANGQDGLLIADVTNKQSPYRIGAADTTYACDVAVRDNYAYVADRTGGLKIIDHSFKQFPVQVGSFDTDGEAWGIELVGDHAYIADFDNGLVIIDVSNPNFPMQVGRMDTGDEAMKVTVAGDRAYIADNRHGLVVADVSVVTNPVPKGHVDTAGMVMDVKVARGHIFVCDGNRLFILGAGDLPHPEVVGYYDASETGGGGMRVAIHGDRAYLANGEAGLDILDISDLSDPKRMGGHDTDGIATDVFVAGDLAYVADLENGLVIIDVSNPLLTREVGHFDTDDQARRVTVDGDHAFVGDRFNGLLIIDVSTPSSPALVGHWEIEGDGHVNGIALSGDHAYLSTGSDGLTILDITNRSDPTKVGEYPTNGWAMLGVNVIGHHALLGDNVHGVVILNVSDPANPREEYHYQTPDAASEIAVLGNYAYVADRYDGLLIGEVTGLMGGTPRAVIQNIDPAPAYTDQQVAFTGRGAGGSGSYDRYEWRSSLEGELYAGPDPGFTRGELTAGNHTISLRVQDSDGTWSYDERTNLVIGHRPEVRIGSPEDGATVEGTVEIRGNATDADGDETILSVEMSVNGGVWETVNGTTAWDVEWDSTTVANGDHTLTFRCRDDIGHSHEVSITLRVSNVVQNTPPEVTITSHQGGEEVSGTIMLEGTASDADGDGTISEVELAIDRGTWNTVTGTTSWQFELDTTTLMNGARTIEVRAFDGTDHSEIVSISLIVNNEEEVPNTPPEVTILAPANNTTVSGLVPLNVRVTDADGDGTIVSVEYSLDGMVWWPMNGSVAWGTLWDSLTVRDGMYEITFRAFDGIDHSPVVRLALTVDNRGASDDEDDDDDGIDAMMVVALLGIVGAVIVVAVFLLLKRREEGDDEVEPSCPDCGEPLQYYEEYQSWYCATCEEYKE